MLNPFDYVIKYDFMDIVFYDINFKHLSFRHMHICILHFVKQIKTSPRMVYFVNDCIYC